MKQDRNCRTCMDEYLIHTQLDCLDVTVRLSTPFRGVINCRYALDFLQVHEPPSLTHMLSLMVGCRPTNLKAQALAQTRMLRPAIPSVRRNREKRTPISRILEDQASWQMGQHGVTTSRACNSSSIAVCLRDIPTYAQWTELCLLYGT